MDWEEMGKKWLSQEANLGALLAPVKDEVVARSGVEPGMKVLDIGCGLGGSVADLAAKAGPDGHVLGVDIAPPLVRRANERLAGLANVEVIEADAQTHAFTPHAFDAMVSVFGSMFFADSAAAFANLHGALKYDAQVTLATWGTRSENPLFLGPGRIAVARLGPMPPFDPEASGPFRFQDGPSTVRLLLRSGFSQASVEEIDLMLTPRGGPEDAAAHVMVVGGAGAVISELGASDADRAAIQGQVTEWFARFDTPQGLRVPARINIFTARA